MLLLATHEIFSKLASAAGLQIEQNGILVPTEMLFLHSM